MALGISISKPDRRIVINAAVPSSVASALDIRVMDLFGNEVVIVPANEVVYDDINDRFEIAIDMEVAKLEDIGDVPTLPDTVSPYFLKSLDGGGYEWVKVDNVSSTIYVNESDLTGLIGTTEERIAEYLTSLTLTRDHEDIDVIIEYNSEA